MSAKRITFAGMNSLFVSALRSVLEGNESLKTEAAENNGVAELRGVMSNPPDALVICQSAPDIALVEQLREMKRRARKMGILFIVRETWDELLSLASERPGIGILHESADIEEFKTALFSVIRGGRYVSEIFYRGKIEREEKPPVSSYVDALTPRERQIMRYVAYGDTNQEIAERLFLSQKTIKNHISHILKKFETTDRTKAAAIAWKEGLAYIPEEFFL
ncbi:MAG: response regulator transcription factor [Synergistes sp.]|nr:response regulator transcription factor [Synergistes sp.]